MRRSYIACDSGPAAGVLGRDAPAERGIRDASAVPAAIPEGKPLTHR